MSAGRSSEAEGRSPDSLNLETLKMAPLSCLEIHSNWNPPISKFSSVKFFGYIFMDEIRKEVFRVSPKAFKCSLATPIYMDGVGARIPVEGIK